MSADESGASGSLRRRTAEEIRVLLARRRMSAAELARLTGIKQSTLARRMTGETAFDLDDLEVIAVVLGVEVTDLIPKRELVGTELKKSLPPPQLPLRKDVVRVTSERRVNNPRRDSVRPVSAIPAARRRPVAVRPANRPIAQ